MTDFWRVLNILLALRTALSFASRILRCSSLSSTVTDCPSSGGWNDNRCGTVGVRLLNGGDSVPSDNRMIMIAPKHQQPLSFAMVPKHQQPLSLAMAPTQPEQPQHHLVRPLVVALAQRLAPSPEPQLVQHASVSMALVMAT